MAIARLNGEVIAESNETVVLGGQYYFPPQSVRAELLRPTDSRDDGYYYEVTIRGVATPEAARSLIGSLIPDPRVANHLEFLAPVEIEE
ncbi:MAG TPA: DUF427 domain-containing protein [Pseudonocardiaceae bacterium]|nr:DUF427 domain-containing protein [Pseudonocardiaceae bacterium]